MKHKYKKYNISVNITPYLRSCDGLWEGENNKHIIAIKSSLSKIDTFFTTINECGHSAFAIIGIDDYDKEEKFLDYIESKCYKLFNKIT